METIHATPQMFETQSSRTKTLGLILLLTIVALFVGQAMAGVAPNAFDGWWQEVEDWLVNAPGKILALAMLAAAAYSGVWRQNWVAAIGAFVFCLVFAQAKDVIEFFLDAGIPVLG